MKKLVKHIKSTWYIYVAWLILAVVLWIVLFTALFNPKKEEKISLFVGAYYCDSATLQDNLQSFTPDYIKKADIRFVPSEDFLFDLYFAAYGTIYADIILLQEDLVKDEKCKEFFLSLSGAITDNNLLYCIDGIPYGIIIEENNRYFYGKNGERTIIFFNKKSQHTGYLNNSDKDGAITIVNALLRLTD